MRQRSKAGTKKRTGVRGEKAVVEAFTLTSASQALIDMRERGRTEKSIEERLSG